MALQEVNAQVAKGERKGEVITINYDLPQTVDEALQRYGEEVVFSRFQSSLVIDIQSAMRTKIRKGLNQDEIQAEMEKWEPQVKAVGRTKEEKVRDLLSKLTPEERAELLSEFMED